MALFSKMYAKVMRWSAHDRARYYLAGVSFAESSFFPIPPDVMLISMGLAVPKSVWQYAWIATLFSVLGGMFGYVIGVYAMVWIEPYLLQSSYAPSYEHIKHWFDASSLSMVIFAGFSPFPYKLFTVTAGAMHLSFLYPFVFGSLLGRGARFFLVSTVLFFAGKNLEKQIRRYIDLLGWLALMVFVLAYLILKWFA